MNIDVRPSSMPSGLMGLKAFKRFTALRPDDERWELRDGIPVMNPSPTNFHQMIANNIQFALTLEARRQGDAWHVFPGTNVVAGTDKPNAPIPDVAVRFGNPLHSSFLNDIVIAFEVISPDSRVRDLKHKPQLYAAIATLQHYVAVDTRAAALTLFDRANDFQAVQHVPADGDAKLTALGVALPFAEIYRQTGLLK